MVSLKSYNTFGIEAKAHDVFCYNSVAALQEFLKGNSLPLLLVGRGSNLLFLKDFEGVVLHATMDDISLVEQNANNITVKVGAGLLWDDWVACSIAQGWYGLENLSLIPGDVGAAAVQNIGAYGAEAKDAIVEVETVDLQTGAVCTFTQKACEYAYRSSIFKKSCSGRYAVTYVTFRLNLQFKPQLSYGGLLNALEAHHLTEEQLTAQQLRNLIIEIRNAKLPNPAVLGNAGSFFMNPVVKKTVYEQLCLTYPDIPHYPINDNLVKIPAGWLIEQSGWKGKRLGPAGVYEHQALVLVNHGGATGKDILRLCRTIQKDVEEKFNIKIEPEVQFVG